MYIQKEGKEGRKRKEITKLDVTFPHVGSFPDIHSHKPHISIQEHFHGS